MFKEIVVLAKSSKHSEYCIAGIDINSGEWIRPVSNNIYNEGSVPIADATYSNGQEVQVLDVVRIKVHKHSPTISQPENYTYDNSVKWEKIDSWKLDRVLELRGYDSPYNVFYNSGKDVDEIELNGNNSLLLLNVKNSCVFIKTFDDGNSKVQFNFEYNGINYKYFKISDTKVKNNYLDKCDGSYMFRKDLTVVFSLTDKYDRTGKYYKMVAQMFY